MIGWLARRVVQAIFVMLAMTVIVFIGVNVIGNPADILIPPDADQIERARVIAQLGLDKPLWEQYASFLWGVLHGDFGKSFVFGEPALKVILQRMPATLELALVAMVFAVLVGIPLGLYAGLRPNAPGARAVMAISILGFSLPSFWVGLLLIMLFSVQLGWLPTGGRGETREFLGMHWSFLTADGLRHLVLPALNLALFKISLVMRLARAETGEVMPQDYVRTAFAKGLSEGAVIRTHVLRNTLIPVATVVGLEFGSVIAFSVVTETIFAWPGMGKLIIDSIHLLDRPMIVAYLLVIVVLFIVINLVVDLIYASLDPRIRLEN
ncbi:ABC transporter permease [Bosea sp. BK604]|uniref:ABC transporter permease n=1 Tax=Bosea sp. BK604 TaxID=2512180 RepID=UPI001049C90B|nr:ABC transporter permease [Bosea sp. BK604]TCR61805.1 peptide/nickel transport system permease protein [Bosea sp. BK604]